jgi:tryptophan synthase beta chain
MNASPALADAPRLLADLIAGRYPDERGRFGPFGGRYVPETLIPALERLERGVREHLHERSFQAQLTGQLHSWVGRPTALTFAARLSARWGAKIFLKREDLAHTGAHKINNAIGQALLALRLGAQRVVAETGAGQHGVASAAACARLGLPCTVYMGSIDMERQAPNVGRMRLLGAEVVPVTSGDRTLRAAIDEALRAWVSDPLDTYYLLGSVVGPHPYPYLVRELQAVIGREARAQLLAANGALPDAVMACVGGGSNSIGAFHAFIPDTAVDIIGVEAGGKGAGLGENAATVAYGRPGVLHGTYSMLLQDADGQVQETHSVSAGLDYPGVGPEHALLAAVGRVRYETASDAQALEGVRALSESEGILPALESAHALAGAARWAKANPGRTLLVCLSGRGDKDMSTLQQTLLAAARP